MMKRHKKEKSFIVHGWQFLEEDTKFGSEDELTSLSQSDSLVYMDKATICVLLKTIIIVLFYSEKLKNTQRRFIIYVT